ncbi:MAG: hypothetical protein J5858_16675 [Lentisphaeria bacterium]|nr:hypothetical protein [Lentisphaeria bacterium]
MKQTWFRCYTFDYSNRDPDKISAYAVGWITIAVLGLCVMFADIAAGILWIVVLGLILTGIMFRKNPVVFKIKNISNIPWIMASFAATYIPTLGLVLLNWQQPNWKILAVCILYTVLVSCLIFYISYRWQKNDLTEDSLSRLHEKSDRSFSVIQNFQEQTQNQIEELQEQIGKSTEELKQKIQPDTRYAEFDKWATVPACLKRVFDILVEDGYRTQKQVDSLSHDTIRINIQKRLRDKNAEKKRDKHADFYKIVDIAEEVSNEFPELQKTMLLAELDRIASPGNDLRRAKR